MHCTYHYGRIYVEWIFEQCFQRDYHSEKPKKKADGTITQVVALMMNKCRGRIVQEYYIMGNIFHKKREQKN